MDIEQTPEVYERVIWQDEPGFNQVRLTINEFRGVEYLHLRKYFLDFEGDFQPSNQGLAIPLEVESTRELFIGLSEIMSLAENRACIEEFFGDIIKDIYCK
jgi:hypothetical protein